MKITPLVSGTILTWKHLLVRHAPQGIRFEVPVICFLLEHAGHKVLFDTGQKILPFLQDPEKANFFVKVTEDQTAKALLSKRTILPADIEYIILSHIHSDHIAGLEDFPFSKVILQKREGLCPGDLPNGFIRPEGEMDLFGDGACRIVPTYGHTPGHQSVLATLENGQKILLCADAAYTSDALTESFSEEERRKEKEFFETLDRIRSMQKDGVKILHSHQYPSASEITQMESSFSA